MNREISHICKEYDIVCRMHHGTDKNNPPNLPKDSYFWNDNAMDYEYGWVESDSSLRKRIMKRIKGEK